MWWTVNNGVLARERGRTEMKSAPQRRGDRRQRVPSNGRQPERERGLKLKLVCFCKLFVFYMSRRNNIDMVHPTGGLLEIAHPNVLRYTVLDCSSPPPNCKGTYPWSLGFCCRLLLLAGVSYLFFTGHPHRRCLVARGCFVSPCCFGLPLLTWVHCCRGKLQCLPTFLSVRMPITETIK